MKTTLIASGFRKNKHFNRHCSVHDNISAFYTNDNSTDTNEEVNNLYLIDGYKFIKYAMTKYTMTIILYSSGI